VVKKKVKLPLAQMPFQSHDIFVAKTFAWRVTALKVFEGLCKTIRIKEPTKPFTPFFFVETEQRGKQLSDC
jgi:hypothetical protein